MMLYSSEYKRKNKRGAGDNHDYNNKIEEEEK